MDTKSIAPAETDSVQPSRLPAGSTLLVNGIHVAHPHAEVNLPGAGDPRLGDTKAVTEEVKHDADGNASVEQRPLDESVKPKVVTVAEVPQVVKTLPSDDITGEYKQAVEQPTLAKTE
jgi:hypothetical protein